MRVRFVIWFLFLSCTHAISEQKDLNISKSSMQNEQSAEHYRSIEEAIKLHKKDEEKHELCCDTITKAQRGKGVSGGINVNHRHRRPTNSATTPLLSWISTVCVSLTLTLVFSFHVRLV
ncbi:hypothetical protein TanjilG_05865 [Lupinus angustifolius]|uniref:Uncharacterized protein n=1 Tax=Lupinus angustifolius TaxID=3871 RepID=A0A4P1RDX4_LUPAN|nr:hypothetical protein TanjilG_05865 [Lupinus angustifolius]